MPHAGIFSPGLKLSRSLTERAAAACAGLGLRHLTVPGEAFFASSPSMPHDDRGGRCRPCLCHQGCAPAWPYEGGGSVLSLDGNILNLADLSPGQGRPGPQLETLFRRGLPAEEFFGDFTLAAYDIRKRTLSLVRSASGGRPLYYCRIGGALAWASDIGLLRRLFGFSPELSPAGADLYLTLNYVPAPRTIYEGLSKLRLGEELVLRAGAAPRARLLERPALRKPLRTVPAAGRALVRELGAAVAHAAASVPRAAVLLSGGLDSSSLVAAGAAAGAGRLDTVTLSFGGGGEDRFALAVAKKYRTRHLVLKVGEPSPSSLAAMAARYNEPVSDDAAVPLFRADELLKEGFSGVITGTGGDELLGGHPWQPRAAEILGAFSGRARLSAAAAADYARKVPHNSHFQKVRLYSRSFHAAAAGALAGHLRGLLARCAAADAVNTVLDCDMKSFLAEYLCMNAYAAFGRKGFKVLTPYLYPRVEDLAAPLPGAWKIKGRLALPEETDGLVEQRGADGDLRREGVTQKFLLREAFKGLLPPEILARGKRGLSCPAAGWLRGRLGKFWYEVVLLRGALAGGFLEKKELQRLFYEHQSGRADHSAEMWNLLMFELWFRETSRH